MKDIVLVPEQFNNCPICGQTCSIEEVEGYRTSLQRQGLCQQFLCINPLADNPLHYYLHLVEHSEPTRISSQGFSLEVGNKYYLINLDLMQQKTLIKNSQHGQPLVLDFIIVPDFPALESLKKKIRTAITFS